MQLQSVPKLSPPVRRTGAWSQMYHKECCSHMEANAIGSKASRSTGAASTDWGVPPSDREGWNKGGKGIWEQGEYSSGLVWSGIGGPCHILTPDMTAYTGILESAPAIEVAKI